MLLAMTLEHQWDIGLLAINVIVLLVSIFVARALATANNGTFRLLWPAYALFVLGAFAVFNYFARYYVR